MPFKDALKKIFIYTGIIIVLVYSLFRVYPLLKGPEITITSPQNGEIVSNGTFLIAGQVHNAKIVKIFDREIHLNPNGKFEERVVFTLPYTRVIVTAIDDWNRSTQEEVTVIQE